MQYNRWNKNIRAAATAAVVVGLTMVLGHWLSVHGPVLLFGVGLPLLFIAIVWHDFLHGAENRFSHVMAELADSGEQLAVETWVELHQNNYHTSYLLLPDGRMWWGRHRIQFAVQLPSALKSIKTEIEGEWNKYAQWGELRCVQYSNMQFTTIEGEVNIGKAKKMLPLWNAFINDVIARYQLQETRSYVRVKVAGDRLYYFSFCGNIQTWGTYSSDNLHDDDDGLDYNSLFECQQFLGRCELISEEEFFSERRTVLSLPFRFTTIIVNTLEDNRLALLFRMHHGIYDLVCSNSETYFCCGFWDFVEVADTVEMEDRVVGVRYGTDDNLIVALASGAFICLGNHLDGMENIVEDYRIIRPGSEEYGEIKDDYERQTDIEISEY